MIGGGDLVSQYLGLEGGKLPISRRMYFRVTDGQCLKATSSSRRVLPCPRGAKEMSRKRKAIMARIQFLKGAELLLWSPSGLYKYTNFSHS